jgi:hypothetical protein
MLIRNFIARAVVIGLARHRKTVSVLIPIMILAVVVPAAGQDVSDTTTKVDPLVENSVLSPEWNYSLRPYFFLSGLSGSVTVDPVTFPINTSFANILQRVKLGGFISFKAENNRWGFGADFQYINLYGESSSAEDTFMDLKNVIGEVDVLFRPESAPTLRFLVGVRAYSIIQNITLLGRVLPQADTIVVDPILGAFGSWMLRDRWNFELRGDIGGFGLSSEFTYQMIAEFRWGITETLSIPFGYRVLGYQIRQDDIWMNTRMSGAMLGLDIRF